MVRVRQIGRAALRSFEQLTTGLGTALLAVGTALWLLLAGLGSLLGLARLLAPPALRALRGVADLERSRLSRRGAFVAPAPPAPTRWRAMRSDPALPGELRWVGLHATLGLALSTVGLLLPVSALRDLSFPAWWWVGDPGEATASLNLWAVYTWWGAVAVSALGLGWVALSLTVSPALARAQAAIGRALLAGDEDTGASARIAELTATRAAALDAHAAELRRIERALHDAEEALAELRVVARGILPPVLDDRGLEGALTGLATTCPVPCRLEVDVLGRCPASVEATAYFVVAEALTNVARHAEAADVAVSVRREHDELGLRIVDDGQGGATEDGGSGLAGIRRRVAAHDGAFTLSSPSGGPTRLEVVLPCGS